MSNNHINVEEKDILFTKNFDPTKMKAGTYAGKNISFYYPLETAGEEFVKVKIQTPMLRVAFKPEEIRTKQDNKLFIANLSLSLEEIGDEQNQKTIRRFVRRMTKMSEVVRDLLPFELKNNVFYGNLYQNPSGKYAPTMKVGMPFNKDETCKSEIFDANKNIIPYNDLTFNKTAMFILRFDGVWIFNNKVGMTWVIEQAKVYGDYVRRTVNIRLNRDELEDDDDDDDEPKAKVIKGMKIRSER
jgi:hypothetical protein